MQKQPYDYLSYPLIASVDEVVRLLEGGPEESHELYRHAFACKKATLGPGVYLRGLIEFSNICRKDCLYCGLRRSCRTVYRYTLPDEEIVSIARKVHSCGIWSIVLQSGELQSEKNTDRICRLLDSIQRATKGEMAVTLSCGEQSSQSYRRWKAAGAQKYLLRIETTNRKLFETIHPPDHLHCFVSRYEALQALQEEGYQTGSGVMIGLPGQTTRDLATDLKFFRDFNIDMVGMGPYIEHPATPLWKERTWLLPVKERLMLTRRMVAVLRLMMPDINIAATTSSETICPGAQLDLVASGANVIMPNAVAPSRMIDYSIYPGKPVPAENFSTLVSDTDRKLRITGQRIVYSDGGAPLHFCKRVHTPATTG